MAGSTDNNIGYLLLHKNGSIERIRTLTTEHQELVTKGLTVIDLDTLAIFNPKEGWENIPSADGDEEEIEEYEEDEFEEEEEDESGEYTHDPFKIYSGAKRCVSPYLVWSYGTGKLR